MRTNRENAEHYMAEAVEHPLDELDLLEYGGFTLAAIAYALMDVADAIRETKA